MRRLKTVAARASLILFAVSILVAALATRSEAIVGDVALTGLPPNSEISLKDDVTGQTETKRSDDGGAVVFFWGSRNSRAGNFTVTARNPSLFPGTPSRRIQLKDGNNRVDLTGLVTVMGGIVPRMPQHVFDFNLSARFFDRTLHPIGTSFALRLDYLPPIACCQDIFTLQPYVSGWAIPSVNIDRHVPFDFKGVYQARVSSGTIGGINVGVKHASDWGSSKNSDLTRQLLGENATIMGVVMAGVGWVRYDFDLKRLSGTEPKFEQVEGGFQKSDNAFRMEFNLGLGASWNNGVHAGVRVGVAPTFTDIFNGGSKSGVETNLGLTLGYRF